MKLLFNFKKIKIHFKKTFSSQTGSPEHRETQIGLLEEIQLLIAGEVHGDVQLVARRSREKVQHPLGGVDAGCRRRLGAGRLQEVVDVDLRVERVPRETVPCFGNFPSLKLVVEIEDGTGRVHLRVEYLGDVLGFQVLGDAEAREWGFPKLLSLNFRGKLFLHEDLTHALHLIFLT